jgi:hypothetical protein
MDRYPQPGSATPQDTVIDVRDMDGPPAGQANRINSHLVYTHGFGAVAARASTAQASTGAPSFTESDIPPTGSLGLKQARVYFGQQETSYAIVGGRQAELDYPNGSTGGQQNTRYTGSGGVPVGSPLNRFLYAVKFRQLNILLSGAIDGNSKIMYIRDPLSRVSKVAPFLTLDGDPYPVVYNGGIDWVVDAYTTTNDYPYSQRSGLRQASTTAISERLGVRLARPGQLHPQFGQGRGQRLHRPGHPLPVGHQGPGSADLDARVPRRDPGPRQDPGRPAGPPALPRGAVRGAAADPGPVPRAAGRAVLRRAELLDRAG